MPANALLLCFCTCPDERSAQSLADALVGERLAACVNQLPGVRSTYRWQGKVCSDNEVLLLIKPRAACFQALRGCEKFAHRSESVARRP